VCILPDSFVNSHRDPSAHLSGATLRRIISWPSSPWLLSSLTLIQELVDISHTRFLHRDTDLFARNCEHICSRSSIRHYTRHYQQSHVQVSPIVRLEYCQEVNLGCLCPVGAFSSLDGAVFSQSCLSGGMGVFLFCSGPRCVFLFWVPAKRSCLGTSSLLGCCFSLVAPSRQT
jgi:hypothetical protein